MDETVKKGIELSKTDSKVENFAKILDWCEKHKDRLPSYRESDGVYVALDEKVQVFPEIFKIAQKHNGDEGTYVSPVIATENMNYILIRIEGENFIMDQLTGLTCVLLELNAIYTQVQLKAVELGENETSWVIGFYGLTRQ